MISVIAVTGNWNEKTAGNHQGCNWKVWWNFNQAVWEETEMRNGYISGEPTHISHFPHTGRKALSAHIGSTFRIIMTYILWTWPIKRIPFDFFFSMYFTGGAQDYSSYLFNRDRRGHEDPWAGTQAQTWKNGGIQGMKTWTQSNGEGIYFYWLLAVLGVRHLMVLKLLLCQTFISIKTLQTFRRALQELTCETHSFCSGFRAIGLLAYFFNRMKAGRRWRSMKKKSNCFISSMTELWLRTK